MNDSTRSQPGRPKVYDSDSERLGAFRSRLESAGYLRKEVLVTRSTAEALGQLAKVHRVTLTDAASALLEYGLQKFSEVHSEAMQGPAEQPAVFASATLAAPEAHFESVAPAGARSLAKASGALRASSLSPMAASASLAAPASPPMASSTQGVALSTPEEDNPIVRFFHNRRQETKK